MAYKDPEKAREYRLKYKTRKNALRRKRYAEDTVYREQELKVRKVSNLKFRYGITPEEYDFLLDNQNGVCAICQVAVVLQVDHCHDTKRVRGLLCHKCNKALGLFGDSEKIIQAALDYLQRID